MIVSQLKCQFLLSVGIFKSSVTKITLRKPLFCYKIRQNVLVRFCHAFDKKDIDKVKVSDLQNPSGVLKCYENIASIKRLSEGLNCTEDEAENILQQYPKLRNMTANNLTKRCEFLAQRNISPGIIINNPWLLIGEKKLFDDKLNLLQCYRRKDPTMAIALLQLPANRLKKVLEWNKSRPNQGQNMERIDFLSEKLKCDEREVCELLHKHQFLLTVPFQRMQAVLKLLEDAGVDKEDIQRDPWILRYQPAQVKARLDKAREAGMLKIKPWMARSTEQTFIKSIERFKSSQEHLGADSSVLDFLTRRLGLQDSSRLLTIVSKHPPILRVSPRKLSNIVDALLSQGFTGDQIIRSPRILCHKVSTLMERLKLLRETYHHEPKGLSALCRSQKEFTKYCNKIKTRLHYEK